VAEPEKRKPGRPRKTVVPPAAPPSNAHAIPPDPPPAIVIQTLDDRAKRVGIKSQVRKRMGLDVKLHEYEEVIELAEEFDEPIGVILRACFRYGLLYKRQWASKASGVSPFSEGYWEPKRPGQIDPQGTGLAGPLPRPAFSQPQFDREIVPVRVPRDGYAYVEPREGTVTSSFIEVDTVFEPPPPRDPRMRGLLPHGATIQQDRGDPPADILTQPDFGPLDGQLSLVEGFNGAGAERAPEYGGNTGTQAGRPGEPAEPVLQNNEAGDAAPAPPPVDSVST
jgi:hypothetical protein